MAEASPLHAAVPSASVTAEQIGPFEVLMVIVCPGIAPPLSPRVSRALRVVKLAMGENATSIVSCGAD